MAARVTSEAIHGQMNVTTEEVQATVTLDQYVERRVAGYLHDDLGYQLVSPGIQPAMLGGMPARRYEIVSVGQDMRVHFIQWVAFVRGTAYVLTTTATEPDAVPLAEQLKAVIGSFVFLDIPPAVAP